MERFEGFRVVRAQLLAAQLRLEKTQRFWRETPPQPVSHLAAVWPEVERAAAALIAAHRLDGGARAVVRWLLINVAVAARGGWPAPRRFPRSLACDLSPEDAAALAYARPALEEELPAALGRAPGEPLSPEDPASPTCAEWLASQLDACGCFPLALAA
jgi:hypothetical protein